MNDNIDILDFLGWLEDSEFSYYKDNFVFKDDGMIVPYHKVIDWYTLNLTIKE